MAGSGAAVRASLFYMYMYMYIYIYYILNNIIYTAGSGAAVRASLFSLLTARKASQVWRLN
jgi:hypothetical protein